MEQDRVKRSEIPAGDGPRTPRNGDRPLFKVLRHQKVRTGLFTSPPSLCPGWGKPRGWGLREPPWLGTDPCCWGCWTAGLPLSLGTDPCWSVGLPLLLGNLRMGTNPDGALWVIGQLFRAAGFKGLPGAGPFSPKPLSPSELTID
jgi:hypothetical protein